MKKREAWNFVLHFFLALVLVALVLFHPWFLLLDVIVWMTLREQAQHRWIIELLRPGCIDEEAYSAKKRTFFDWTWFKWHHAGEIGQAALGALVALGGYEIYRAFFA